MSETEKGNVGVSAAIDPVCGMTVEKAGARAKARHAGRDYFFCSAGCLTKFTADPSAVLAGGPKAKGSGLVSIGMPVAAKASAAKDAAGATNAASGAASGRDARQDSRVYVCPMCAEVRQIGPGPCPKCGMALEPESPAFEATKIGIYLPDASRDCADGAGELSDLRDGAGAANCERCAGREC